MGPRKLNLGGTVGLAANSLESVRRRKMKRNRERKETSWMDIKDDSAMPHMECEMSHKTVKDYYVPLFITPSRAKSRSRSEEQ